MKEKVNYIYKIHFLCGFPVGRYYLGKHTGYVDDSYAGSGKFCKAYYKKYGKINGITYIKEILEINPDKETNKIREEIIVSDLWKTDPLCMNQKRGGEGKGWEIGHVVSKEAREKIASALSNPVDQYDLNGNFIKTWKSIAEVSRSFHCHVTSISDCCSGRRYTCKGYIWRRHGEKISEQDLLNVNKYKIACFNLDGTLYKIYNSVKDAAEENNVNINSIENCCSGIRGKVKTFVYRHYNDVKDNLLIPPYKSQERAILQYDKLWNYIRTYNSMTEAALDVCGSKTGIKNISACCKGDKNSAYGYKWKYKEA